MMNATGEGIGWWFMLIALGAAVIPFFIVDRKRWWPCAWGWAIDIATIGLLVSDNFRNWGAVGIAGLIIGTVLGFTGVLIGPNSPAK